MTPAQIPPKFQQIISLLVQMMNEFKMCVSIE